MSDNPDPSSSLPASRIQWIYLIAAFILVPLSSAIFGYISSSEQNKIEYVRIALSILNSNEEESAEQKQVLDTLAPWAIEILSESAPIKLTEPQKEALKSRKAKIPYWTGDNYSYGGYDYNLPGKKQDATPVE